MYFDLRVKQLAGHTTQQQHARPCCLTGFAASSLVCHPNEKAKKYADMRFVGYQLPQWPLRGVSASIMSCRKAHNNGLSLKAECPFEGERAEDVVAVLTAELFGADDPGVGDLDVAENLNRESQTHVADKDVLVDAGTAAK
jgi:hypothetical protein